HQDLAFLKIGKRSLEIRVVWISSQLRQSFAGQPLQFECIHDVAFDARCNWDFEWRRRGHVTCLCDGCSVMDQNVQQPVVTPNVCAAFLSNLTANQIVHVRNVRTSPHQDKSRPRLVIKQVAWSELSRTFALPFLDGVSGICPIRWKSWIRWTVHVSGPNRYPPYELQQPIALKHPLPNVGVPIFKVEEPLNNQTNRRLMDERILDMPHSRCFCSESVARCPAIARSGRTDRAGIRSEPGSGSV